MRSPCRLACRCWLLVLFMWLPAHSEPLHRLSLAGLCDLSVDLAIPNDRLVGALVPAGDMDGDGKEELLLRLTPRSQRGGGKDEVVLLYGQPFPAGPLDVLGQSTRKSVVTTGEYRSWVTVGQLGNAARWDRSLGGGEDVDGDAHPDLLITSGFEASVNGPAVLLIHGAAGGLPAQLDASAIGRSVRGSIITNSDPPVGYAGEMIALAPDVNGDGLAEILILERANIVEWNRCHVIFGSSQLPLEFDLRDVGDSIAGFAIENQGPSAEQFFAGISGLGDIDGDGLGDLGFYVDSLRGGLQTCFILFGRETWPGSLVLEEQPPGSVIEIPQRIGVNRAGDVNGDGVGDVLFAYSEEKETPWPGVAEILYGRARTAFPDVITRQTFQEKALGNSIIVDRQLDGAGGLGTTDVHLMTATGNDIDKDGKAEVLFSYKYRHHEYPTVTLGDAGVDFLIWGSDSLPAETLGDIACQRPLIDDARCPSIDFGVSQDVGVQLDGGAQNEQSGRTLCLLNDFDGDGMGDLLIASAVGIGRFERIGRIRIISGRSLLAGLTPRLGKISPTKGPLGGGNLVLIFGAGFSDNTVVRFDGVPAVLDSVLGSGILLVKAPAASVTGPVSVTVKTALGETNGCGVTYTYVVDQTEGVSVGSDSTRNLTVRHQDSAAYRSLGTLVGDWNGDGKTDIALADEPAADASADAHLHLVFGDGRREGTEVLVDGLAPPHGATLIVPRAELSLSAVNGLAASGDLDGDGRDDLVLHARIGVEAWDIISGRDSFPSGVVYGSLPGVVRIASFSRFGDLAGVAAVVPDLVGDGTRDLIISYWDLERDSAVYVVHDIRGLAGAIFIEDLAAQGRASVVTTDLAFDVAVGPAGDVNGDGIPDVFLSGRGSGPLQFGSLAIIYGGPQWVAGGTLDLRAGFFGDANGLLVSGNYVLVGRGLWPVFPGDLDGDGADDMLIRQQNQDECSPGPCSGEMFAFDRETVLQEGLDPSKLPAIAEVYGRKSTGAPDFAPLPLSLGPQPGVLRIAGGVRYEGMGAVACPAGDFNGDGFPDVLIGNKRLTNTEQTSNTCYVVFGRPDFYETPGLDLTSLNGPFVKIRGAGLVDLGTFVAGRFDWDADGVDDVLLGSADGRADIVFGKRRGELPFIRGDANRDQLVNISDAVFILGYLFLGNRVATCLDALDSDDSGALIITDAVFLLQSLFLGGRLPPEPYPAVGNDPTPDALGCEG